MVAKPPSIPPPKLGPTPPTSASAAPGGGSFRSHRNFDLKGVRTSSFGLAANPALRRSQASTRQQTGGSS